MTVELLADDGMRLLHPPVVTDERGGFTFDGVPPGAYKLVEIADDLSGNDPAILGTVVLSQGESRRFALDLANMQ